MGSVESLCLKEKKGRRKVKVTNVHLSFPSSDNDVENEVRQQNEVLNAILYNDSSPFSSSSSKTGLEVVKNELTINPNEAQQQQYIPALQLGYPDSHGIQILGCAQ
eukprot:4960590-Ditylum_brightwellii.AAC.1